MNLRNLSVVLVLALFAIFTLLNWSAFLTPTTLSLGLAEVQAPLGLVMLGAMVGVSGLFLLYILAQQGAAIMESRRMAKELKAQRELADRAEASRFTEMRALIEAELRRLEAQAEAAARIQAERLDRLEAGLGEQLAESTRTLSAYVGEVEDKLDRLLPGLPRA